MENEQLYKRSSSMPLLICLNHEEANYVLRELHEGTYGSHVARISLAFKALRNGYFQPTMKVDALKLVKRYDKCQRHSYVLRKPSSKPFPLIVAQPFDQWGINLLCPFPTTPDWLKYLVVNIEYLTKQIKAEPLATITTQNAQKFVWKNIVC